ncbi:shikimate kinase [Microbacterium awajiense]|uniref:Shikimate kinase n=1 Tax=Microbacterium awajiense TaxID=415214 RepID=A0ABP7A4Q5_9MICO
MTSRTDAIVLIGPMGAGKTSVGRRVAKALDVTFYDSDKAIVRDHGPIEAIFAERGEAAFRAIERDAVATGLATAGVVSLGGGAVLDEQTRAALADHRVVLLTVEPRVVASRIRGGTRPLLNDGDPMTRWNAIMRERGPLYRELADVVFDTSHGPLQEVVDAITAWARTSTQEDA